jgi:hypothetical protein
MLSCRLLGGEGAGPNRPLLLLISAQQAVEGRCRLALRLWENVRIGAQRDTNCGMSSHLRDHLWMNLDEPPAPGGASPLWRLLSTGRVERINQV